MTPEQLEEIKKNVDLWLDDDGSVVELITALEEAEADRDKWMGQFDEAEHRGLAYMEERDKLGAQVKLLESDLKNSHACWNAACEDITKYKARVKELAKLLIFRPHGTYLECRICKATWWEDERTRHNLTCPVWKEATP